MRYFLPLLIAALLLAVPGCFTKAYHEKMAATDWLFSQGRYDAAENALAKEAGDKAQVIIPATQGGGHE